MRLPRISKLRIIGASIGVLAIVGGITSFAIWRSYQQPPSALHPSQTFPVLSPATTLSTPKGSWQRSPDDTSVYVYTDTVTNVAITVNQQVLPATFKDSPAEKVAELAKSYNANRSISVKNIKVFIGANAKGPQWAIFTTNGLLVLIKSEKTITDAAWTDYVGALL